MNNCHEYQENLSFYIDDCMSAEEKAQLEEHLKNCPECRKELAELQETVNMLADLDDEIIPPASFRRKLREKIELEEKASKPSIWDKVLQFFNKGKFNAWLPLAAAAVLLVVIAPVVIYGLGSMGSSAKMEQAQDAGPMDISLTGENRAAMKKSAPVEYGEKQKAAPMAEAPRDDVSFPAKGEEATISATQIERKIIKTGHLKLEVDSYKAATTKINDLVQQMQGYIVNENSHIYDNQRQLMAGNMAVRIPQERFNEALNIIEGIGKVNNRSVDAHDVTEEYVDVESRLIAMRVKEERLLDILGKSGELGDVLAVENELARTRSELEALEGRLRYLNNRTELSTINLSIRETLTPVKQIKTTGLEGVLARTQEAFIKSINSIIIGTGNLVVFVGSYIPFLLIGLVLLIVGWAIVRKMLKKLNKLN